MTLIPASQVTPRCPEGVPERDASFVHQTIDAMQDALQDGVTYQRSMLSLSLEVPLAAKPPSCRQLAQDAGTYTRVPVHAWSFARGLGVHAVGVVVGVLRWMARLDSAPCLGADNWTKGRDVELPRGPLWEVFCWFEQNQDDAHYGAWLCVNGAQNEAQAWAMQDLAGDMVEAHHDWLPVVLRDCNLPLLHPFAHADEENFAACVEHIAQAGTYASGTEARAVAEALKVRILVYQEVAHEGYRPTVELGVSYGAADAAHTLHIRHNGHAHWEGVRRRKGAPDDEPLSIADQIIRTAGDGNCLFHAIRAALRTTSHPAAHLLKHDTLRALAVEHMRENAADYTSHIRLEADIARSYQDKAYQDQIDAQAVRAVLRSHMDEPWETTWKHLAAHAPDVQSFNGVQLANRTSRAMDRLVDDMLRRLGAGEGADALSPQDFLQALAALGEPYQQTVSSLLLALSAGQRLALVRTFMPTPDMALADAETTLGAMFDCLTLRDRQLLIGGEELNKMIVRELQEPQRRWQFIDRLADELDATRCGTTSRHPLSAMQWSAVGTDPAVLRAVRDALLALGQAPQEQPARWRTMYRIVDTTPPAHRDAFLSALLREAPQVFARLGCSLNQRNTGGTARDLRDQADNQAAIDILFGCLTSPV